MGQIDGGIGRGRKEEGREGEEGNRWGEEREEGKNDRGDREIEQELESEC